MEVPNLKAGDILVYQKTHGNKYTTMLLLEDATEVEARSGQENIQKIKYLHNERVGQNYIELLTLLNVCDIFRQGTKIWCHTNAKMHPQISNALKDEVDYKACK